jgi:hypothetical protein
VSGTEIEQGEQLLQVLLDLGPGMDGQAAGLVQDDDLGIGMQDAREDVFGREGHQAAISVPAGTTGMTTTKRVPRCGCSTLNSPPS